MFMRPLTRTTTNGGAREPTDYSDQAMEESVQQKIRDIKRTVRAMVEERRALENGNRSVTSPSTYWSEFCSYFDYMFGMDELYYAKLRLHTYHLTGDNYQFYYFTDNGQLGGPEAFRRNLNLDELTAGLPAEFVLNEPEGGIGFRYDDGRFISYDVARFQRVVSSLYRHKVIAELLSSKKRPRVLEIGAGYGGLTHHLSNILGDSAVVIVDLPETLLFSASYLTLLNPHKKLYLYNPGNSAEVLEGCNSSDYDFILIPNYELGLLKEWKFDLALNVGSLQEMRTAQVEEYLDFIRSNCDGVFYSWNEDRQQRNSELNNLSDLLKERFDLIDITKENLMFDPKKSGVGSNSIAGRKHLKKVAKKFGQSVGLVDDSKIYPAYTMPSYKEYLAVNKTPN